MPTGSLDARVELQGDRGASSAFLRSNFVGMGMLPLQLARDGSAASLGLSAAEEYFDLWRRRRSQPPARCPARPPCARASGSSRCARASNAEGGRVFPPRRDPAVRAQAAAEGTGSRLMTQSLRLRDRSVRVAGDPLLMDIVNASPDSFSEPGRRGLGNLANRARGLSAAGAALRSTSGDLAAPTPSRYPNARRSRARCRCRAARERALAR